MNLLETATAIATTSDVDALFAIYTQSRSYTNGKKIREQIEKRVQEIASLNGYEGEFKSFRELVEFHDNETSPLWNFPRSDDVLVARKNHPMPYKFKEFLRLFKNTYDLRGFVYADESEEGLVWTKYKMFKEKDGTIKFYASLRFGKEFSVQEYVREAPAYEEYTLDEIPEEVLAEIFQPSDRRRVWNVAFVDDIYEKIDAIVDGVSIVYDKLPASSEFSFVSLTSGTRTNYHLKFECETVGKYHSKEFESKILILNKKVIHLDIRDNELIKTYITYKPYFKLSDPSSLRDLPHGLRYATYSLTTQDDEEESYGTYSDDENHSYVASYNLLSEEEIERIEEEGGLVTHLSEFSNEIHYYEIEYDEDTTV